MSEALQIRIHGPPDRPTLIYLPGIHGDWTLVASFRAAIGDRVRFVEFTYPRTLTWSLDDYAAAIRAALLTHGVTRGTVLAESFGSQIAWPLVAIAAPELRLDALILAGGFVRYPAKWCVRLARGICRDISLTWLTRLLHGYAKYARLRHRHAPETLAGIAEFMARRTELDRQAATHRLDLIHANDPQSQAAQVALPVFALTGFFDPIVPWWLVRPWLRRHCPGYRGGRIVVRADHNVLGTAPQAAALQVWEWMQQTAAVRR